MIDTDEKKKETAEVAEDSANSPKYPESARRRHRNIPKMRRIDLQKERKGRPVAEAVYAGPDLMYSAPVSSGIEGATEPPMAPVYAGPSAEPEETGTGRTAKKRRMPMQRVYAGPDPGSAGGRRRSKVSMAPVYAGPDYFNISSGTADGFDISAISGVYAGPEPAPQLSAVDEEKKYRKPSPMALVYAGPQYFMDRQDNGKADVCEMPEEAEMMDVYAGPAFFDIEEGSDDSVGEDETDKMSMVYAGPSTDISQELLQSLNTPCMMVYAGPDYFNNANSAFSEAAAKGAATPAEAGDVPDGTGYCKVCGGVIDPGKKFCPECGARVEEKKAVAENVTGTTCLCCGSKVAPGMKFCPECGAIMPEDAVET